MHPEDLICRKYGGGQLASLPSGAGEDGPERCRQTSSVIARIERGSLLHLNIL